ncbi:hypothetical protein EFB08_23145 [Rufibacter latericius]|uniref:Uncharacterized protein n=1 Tax=Rufibacter latericius TaxID=2487040 RepID=A0A3M9M8Z9_9BACT|nr:hypothetical protein EFB08_23145 [Rufibacter latericius]
MPGDVWVGQKQAIEVFMARYGFEESDVKFDSLKKAYQRYWNKKLKTSKQKLKGVDFLPFLFSLQTVKALDSRYRQKKVRK